MKSIQRYFREELFDLGQQRPEYAGILTPASEIGSELVGVTSQFLDDAGTYHERYSNVEYFTSLLRNAFSVVEPGPDSLILDLGSGSGNSVFGCLDLLPGSQIIATDISPDLLRILGNELAQHGGAADRTGLVCMSATNDVCQPGTFDLVVGAAILHHLIAPEEAIAAAGSALRPGGSAIFFEPFENGNAVLGLAYREILEEMDNRRDRKRYKEGLDVLRALGHDLRTRRGRDKSDPIFRKIDDKWLFTRSFIEELAGKGGFASVDIRPIHSVERPFTQQTVTNLRLAANLGPEALPPSCWEKLAVYDEAFSDDLKTDLFLEASIILRK